MRLEPSLTTAGMVLPRRPSRGPCRASPYLLTSFPSACGCKASGLPPQHLSTTQQQQPNHSPLASWRCKSGRHVVCVASSKDTGQASSPLAPAAQSGGRRTTGCGGSRLAVSLPIGHAYLGDGPDTRALRFHLTHLANLQRRPEPAATPPACWARQARVLSPAWCQRRSPTHWMSFGLTCR